MTLPASPTLMKTIPPGVCPHAHLLADSRHSEVDHWEDSPYMMSGLNSQCQIKGCVKTHLGVSEKFSPAQLWTLAYPQAMAKGPRSFHCLWSLLHSNTSDPDPGTENLPKPHLEFLFWCNWGGVPWLSSVKSVFPPIARDTHTIASWFPSR